jgi:two-component system OmpR family response regulator
MTNTRVLSIEDDPNLAMVMRHYMEDEGYQLTQASTAKDGLDVLDTKEFDIVLMDLGLPDSDGLTLITQIKEKFSGPVLIISGKTDTTDRIIGLEMGADDYITKPFEMRELIARIKANLRRPSQSAVAPSNENEFNGTSTPKYIFANWVYNPAKLALKDKDGDSIELTSGECELLEMFLKSNGRALSREYLFEQTRGENFDSFDRSIDIQITRLRKKLSDDPKSPHLFKTVRGIGYMFIADVKKDNAA